MALQASKALPSHQKVVRLADRPKKDRFFLPVSNEPIPTFDKNNDVAHETMVLVHRLYLSLDPAMRGWMTNVRSYLPPVPIGEVMRGATLGEVVAVYDVVSNDNNSDTTTKSKKGKLKVGDIVSDFSSVGGWQEYALVTEKSVRRVETLAELTGSLVGVELPMTVHLSIFGTTGLTAYFGFIDVCAPRPPSWESGRPPETILVTAAAGAVGSIVCQIAKFAYGCKVIGVAGGPKKCSFLRDDLKCCDVVIDYRAMESAVQEEATGKPGMDEASLYQLKARQFQKQLRNALKQVDSKGFDMFFDNVGGYMLNEGLARLNYHARVALCGAISGYNIDLNQQQSSSAISPTALHMKHGMAMISLRAKIQGFIVLDYIKQWGKARQQLAKWIVEGKIRYQKEDIREGLENAPGALLDLFNGKNKGKLIVKIGDRITSSDDDSTNVYGGIRSKL